MILAGGIPDDRDEHIAVICYAAVDHERQGQNAPQGFQAL